MWKFETLGRIDKTGMDAQWTIASTRDCDGRLRSLGFADVDPIVDQLKTRWSME